MKGYDRSAGSGRVLTVLKRPVREGLGIKTGRNADINKKRNQEDS